MKYRLRWAKTGKIRFISHHDVAMVLDRSFRRAHLPIAYSKGFSPRPRIAFGSGLPVGYGSEVELLDLELTEDLDPAELCERLDRGLPPGFYARAAARLPGGAPSLDGMILAADYLVRCEAPWVSESAARFMALASYEHIRQYKGKPRTDDLRSGVEEIRAIPGGLGMRCTLKPRGTRPSDVFEGLAKLAGATAPASFERIALLAGDAPHRLPLDERTHLLEVVS